MGERSSDDCGPPILEGGLGGPGMIRKHSHSDGRGSGWMDGKGETRLELAKETLPEWKRETLPE